MIRAQRGVGPYWDGTLRPWHGLQLESPAQAPGQQVFPEEPHGALQS